MSERCQKKMVATPGLRMHYHPCRRKAWKDGWCKQHHPDSIAERRAKSDALYEERQKNSPLARLGKAVDRIRELEEGRDNARQLANLLRIRTEAAEAEVARLRIDIKEMTDCYHAMQQEEMEQRGKAIAAEAKLRAIAELQRYTIMADTYITDNPNGEWLRADELETLLEEDGM